MQACQVTAGCLWTKETSFGMHYLTRTATECKYSAYRIGRIPGGQAWVTNRPIRPNTTSLLWRSARSITFMKARVPRLRRRWAIQAEIDGQEQFEITGRNTARRCARSKGECDESRTTTAVASQLGFDKKILKFGPTTLKFGMVMSTEQTRTAPCVIHTTNLTQTRTYAASEAACGRRGMSHRNA